jgi:RimJ/RimL family protein N-acetyltransferase
MLRRAILSPMPSVRLDLLTDRYVEDLERLAADPDVQRNTYVPEPPPAGFGCTWLEAYAKAREAGTREGFAILDADTGAFLGIASAVHLDEDAGEAELGYILAPEARGRGAATEALTQLTEWAFAKGLVRLELRIDAANEASVRVAERCGYTREGLLRSVHFKPGRRTDVLIYSRLPGD